MVVRNRTLLILVVLFMVGPSRTMPNYTDESGRNRKIEKYK